MKSLKLVSGYSILISLPLIRRIQFAVISFHNKRLHFKTNYGVNLGILNLEIISKKQNHKQKEVK